VLDSVRGVVRSAIGAAEHVEVDVQADVESHTPAHVEAKLDEVIVALHRAADSAERHVEVVEGLADTLTPLTEAVARLTDQINLLLQVTAPLAAVERDVARVRDLRRVGGLVHRLGMRPAVPPRSPGPRPPVPPGAPGGPGA